LTGHFHCTPTSGWGWNFFGLPLGEQPPTLPPERPNPQQNQPDDDEPNFWSDDED
jgi:hypothetical protein